MESSSTKVLSRNKDEKNPMVRYLTFFVVMIISLSIGIFIGREFDTGFLSDLGSGIDRYRVIGDVSGDSANVREINFDHFWNVWNTMVTSYVDKDAATEKEMFYGAIKGLVSSYGDPATIFLDPEETELFNKSTMGNYFSGIGAELGYNKEGRIIVISPIKGSPAIAAGIRAGDMILAVDDEDIAPDANIYDVVMRIRGEEGTTVKLVVYSEERGEPTEIEITRGEITIPSMEFKASELDSDYALVDISRFTDTNLNDWQKNWDGMVDRYLQGNYKGMIIDVRGNPGGYLNAAVYAANDFLQRDKIVYQSENRQGKTTSFKVTRSGRLLDIPVVILVNEGSASASEILAGALQLNDRAVVVGVPTYGKGTAQEIVEFKDGSTLHITVMKWLLPDGSWLSRENNIVPDHEIELTEEDFKVGNDPQMQKAVEVIKTL